MTRTGLRAWWCATLLLAALGLVMGGAHVLELPMRAQYEPAFYMRVTSTMLAGAMSTMSNQP